MHVSPSTFDQSSSTSRSTRRKRLWGVAALVGCFVVTLLLLVGVSNLVRGQTATDSLALLPPTPTEDTAERNAKGRSAVRLPVSSAAWRTYIGAQSALLLRMPSTSTKAQTMQNLITFANLYGPALDLSDAVPALVTIYERETDDRLQTMALAALHAIGDEGGMKRVLQLFADPYFRHQRISPRLRHMTHAALAEYIQEREQMR